MISKLNLGPLHKRMHTQMYMHQHICGPTQIPTYIDTTHMWKRKRKTKKKEVDSYLNTPAWEGGPENTMQTLPVSVNYVWTFIAMDEIGWHLAVDHRDFLKNWRDLGSVQTILSLHHKSWLFQICTSWVQKMSLCHSTPSRIKEGSIQAPKGFLTVFYQTSYQEPYKM